MEATTSDSAPGELTGLNGSVIAPGDPGYDEARKVKKPGVDRRPRAVVQPADAADVSRVVRFAAETGLPLAVRSGAHSGAGHGTVEGGIVLDMTDMDGVEIDPEARVARAGGGILAADYIRTAGEHGLATGFGDSGTVGVSGITLGGGVGFLTRKHGLTIDALLGAQIVTADGEVREVGPDSEPDLFWAIRGGGGNFGVVTRLDFRLFDVSEFTGGMLLLPLSAEVLAGAVAAAQSAPEELSLIANAMKAAPPMPFLPPEIHGQPVLMLLIAFAGPAAEAQRAVAPFRALAEPLADMVAEQPLAAMYPPDEAEMPVPATVIRTGYADGFGRAEAESVVDALSASPAPMAIVQLRPLGGVAARVANEATAYAHRDRSLMFGAVAMYQGEEQVPSATGWAEAVTGRLTGGREGAYVNFLSDEGAERVREAYPGSTWDRLREIKARYDPANLFQGNQNIPPA